MAMHSADKSIFLIACPILLILQIIIVSMFVKNHQSLFTKPGNIFFALVILEIGLNLHLIASSSIGFLICSLLYGELQLYAG